jgi:hypothetical protein
MLKEKEYFYYEIIKMREREKENEKLNRKTFKNIMI